MLRMIILNVILDEVIRTYGLQISKIMSLNYGCSHLMLPRCILVVASSILSSNRV